MFLKGCESFIWQIYVEYLLNVRPQPREKTLNKRDSAPVLQELTVSWGGGSYVSKHRHLCGSIIYILLETVSRAIKEITMLRK